MTKQRIDEQMSPASPPGGSPDKSVAEQGDTQPTASATPEFLTSLVDAMRRVVETTRETALAELQAAADVETALLDARRAEREATLRERAESDINSTGTWERSEIERIRAEAMSKVAGRREQLDRELAELSASSDAERAALLDRAGAYERDTAVFMKELAGVNDPAAFAAIAGRMPPAPEHVRPAVDPKAAPADSADPSAPKEASPVPSEWAAPAMAERLAELNKQAGVSPETHAPQGEEEATAIEVHGLSSFGAITSLKQSLERVTGIRSVALALGPGGDFVYTAIHIAGFDMAGAIRSIEGEAVQIDGENGTLRVKIPRGKG